MLKPHGLLLHKHTKPRNFKNKIEYSNLLITGNALPQELQLQNTITPAAVMQSDEKQKVNSKKRWYKHHSSKKIT